MPVFATTDLTAASYSVALFGLGATAVPFYIWPEPGTFALLGCGLFGLLAYAWCKRKGCSHAGSWKYSGKTRCFGGSARGVASWHGREERK